MNLIDVVIPLGIGLLLVVRPQAFFKPTGSQEESTKRSATLRKIGWVLIAVGALYVVIVVVRSGDAA